MEKKKLLERTARLKTLDAKLKKLFPVASIALVYSNDWELMVAVQLSAQCTDKMVNRITEKLFKKYKTLNDYVAATQGEFEQDIKQAGYYRNKAKNILGAARMVKERFHGKLPKTMEEMLLLPGVARKTANVVLSNAFGIADGIAVDTHVRRFVIRYDLSDFKDPVRIEKDLLQMVPKKDWNTFTYRVIEYGRTIAPARRYDLSKDPLIKIYPKAGEVFRV